jgi:hypothetical protein
MNMNSVWILVCMILAGFLVPGVIAESPVSFRDLVFDTKNTSSSIS